MEKTKIAILGGYGNTGLRVARGLAKNGNFEIVLLGRDGAKAKSEAEKLRISGCGSITGGEADASNLGSLKHALLGIDIVLSATSDTKSAPIVMRAAIDLGIDYMDCHLSSSKKWAALRALEGEIVKRDLCFITDGGFHPGVPAAMIRAAGNECEIETADVYGYFNIDWAHLSFGKNAPEDFMAELYDMDPSAFVNGKWKRDWNNLRRHDFGKPYGVQKCIAMNFEEMKSLPALFPSLRDTGFFIGGFGPLIDNFVIPACMAALWAFPRCLRAIGRVFLFALKRGTRREQWAVIELDGTGKSKDKKTPMKLRLFHEDPYELTAEAIVSCLEQYQSRERRPGLWSQAHFVDTQLFFASLRDKGAQITGNFSL